MLVVDLSPSWEIGMTGREQDTSLLGQCLVIGLYVAIVRLHRKRALSSPGEYSLLMQVHQIISVLPC